jgi:hypothetical protein
MAGRLILFNRRVCGALPAYEQAAGFATEHLNAQYQPDRMNPFPDTKREFLLHFIRIEVRSKYSVPNGKQ